MSKGIIANVDTLNDIQRTELQVVLVGLKKVVEQACDIAYSQNPITYWELILFQEHLAETNECLHNIWDNTGEQQ